MPMKSIDVKIGQNSFNITTFGFIQGISIQKKLIKLLSPFGYLINFDSDKGLLEQEISSNNIHIFIEKVCENLDDNDRLIDLILELCSTTLVNNKEMTKDQIDIIFAGDYQSMYQLIGKIININNFLPEGTIGVAQFKQLTNKIVPQSME